MDIDAILAVDWAKYVSEALIALTVIVTAIDKFVEATPTKRDDEIVKPITSKVLGFLARFSWLRGKR